jgi:hypothetical protein
MSTEVLRASHQVSSLYTNNKQHRPVFSNTTRTDDGSNHHRLRMTRGGFTFRILIQHLRIDYLEHDDS